MIWLLIPFCLISFLLRFQLLFQLFPVNHVGVDYYHGRKLWANEIHALAGNSPVIFENNFRESSLYAFYSGQIGVALFSGETRKSQYDLWHYEDSLQNKNIFLFKKDSFPGSIPFHSSLGKTSYYSEVSQLHSFYNIPVHANFPGLIHSNNNCHVDVSIENPRKLPLTFNNNISGAQTILFCRINGQNKIIDFDLIVFASSDTIPGVSTKTIAVNLETATLDKGKYNVSFGFRNPPLQDSFNAAYDFTVK